MSLGVRKIGGVGFEIRLRKKISGVGFRIGLGGRIERPGFKIGFSIEIGEGVG